MRYILFLLFCSLSFAQTATFESYGAVANNTGINNATALNNALTDLDNGIITTLTGTGGSYYNFDTSVNFSSSSLSGQIIATGTGRMELYSDNLESILRINGNANDFELNRVKFNSTRTTAVSNQNEASLLYYNNGVYTNLSLIDCEFTAPSINANGVKFNLTGGSASLDGFIVSGTYLHHLGRMGLEIVQHEYISGGDYEIPKYFNVLFEYNIIDNVGLIQYGMGISFSGPGQFNIVRFNAFKNCPTTAIELIGVIDTDVYDNTFEGDLDIVHLVKGSGRRNIRVNVYDNNTIGTITGGFTFISGKDVSLYNNTLTQSGNNYFKGIENLILNNENYKSSNSNLITVVSDSPSLFTDIEIHNSTLRANSGSVILAGTNEGSVSINISCSDIYKSSGGSFLSLGGTSNGIPSITYNDTNRYSNNVFIDNQNPNGTYNCLALPSNENPEPIINSIQTFYDVWYNN